MSIRLNSLTLGIVTFVLTFLLVIFAGSTILLSPSHPFIDQNGNGIDDFEEKSGQYEDPAIRAKLYGVNFPIADLGNCGSYNECRSYCEDPVNSESCINFGKSKGFYHDDPVVTKKDEILAEAKQRLGCDSYESCLNFCEVPANFEKCHSFATNQGVVGGYVHNPEGQRIITKAKEVLGCDSANSCKAFCLQQDNISKCKQFAEDTGLRGGEQRVGPGGCTSENTCKSFCSDPNNFQVCQGFTQVSGGTFTGPGGCSSPESCRSYCQEHPADCGYKPGQTPGTGISPIGGNYNPAEMCNRTPNCSWGNNGCQCGFYGETKETVQKAGEYAGFCAANPDKCKTGQAGGFESSLQRQQFEDFCKQNPDKCRPPSDSASPQSSGLYGGVYYGGGGGGFRPDPAAECSRYGCTWTGNGCQCTGITSASNYSGGGSGGSNPSYSPRPGETYSPPPGGSYSGSGSSYTPPPGGSYSGGSYSGGGSYTPPSGSGSYTPPSGGSTAPAPTTTQSAPPAPSSGDSGGSAPPPPSGDSGGGGGSAPPPPPSGDSGGGGGYTPPSGGDSGGYTHGVSTSRGLLQILWDILQGK